MAWFQSLMMVLTPSCNWAAFSALWSFLSASPNFTALLFDPQTWKCRVCTSLSGCHWAKKVAPSVLTKPGLRIGTEGLAELGKCGTMPLPDAILMFLTFPTCSTSSKNHNSINNTWREGWGLARGAPKEWKTTSLLILAPKMSITSWGKGMQNEVLTTCSFACRQKARRLNLPTAPISTLMHNAAQDRDPKPICFCQVHSHLLECMMWHRTDIQNPFVLPSALTSAWMHNAAQDRDSKKKKYQKAVVTECRSSETVLP